MSDDDHCQNHPDQPVTARCARFNRRFCELDFPGSGPEVECLSAGMHCEERPRCLIWEKLRRARLKKKRVVRGGADTPVGQYSGDKSVPSTEERE